MSVHYLIDGYNLMYRLFSEEGSFEEQRHQVISALNEKIQHASFAVTLVFDAQYQEGDARRSHFRHLEILFSGQGETADALILSLIQGKSSYTVVTSDRQLASTARRFGAKTLTVEAFLTKLKKKKGIRKEKTLEEPKPGTSSSQSFDYYLHQFEKRFRQQMND